MSEPMYYSRPVRELVAGDWKDAYEQGHHATDALRDALEVMPGLLDRIAALEAENKRLARGLAEGDAWKWLPMSPEQHRALYVVIEERGRQESKWGEQNHDPFTYLAILTEEVGELAQAALHARFGGTEAVGLTTEAIHTAAVALAIVECLLREKWVWPGEVAK